MPEPLLHDPAASASPCDASCSGADPRRRDAALIFGPAPSSWRPRPPELKPFVCDYDLPGRARANALYYPMEPDAFRAKVLGHWTTDDGRQHSDVRPLTIGANGIPVDLYELSGTYSAGSSLERGRKLLVGYVHAPGGAWTVMLGGPKASVDAESGAFVRWLSTVRLVPVVG